MKLYKSYIYAALGAVLMSTASCNDFLDRNRYPLDTQTDNPEYWTSKENLEAQVNALYANFTGYGNTTSWVNNFYYRSLSDDQCGRMQSGSGIVFAEWDYQYAPEANSVWDATYTVLRKCNYIINNANVANVIENNDFIAKARLIRAQQNWELVRALGDVPLVTEVLDPSSPELYGERTNRNVVMDFVLEDLNFAVENIVAKSDKLEMSKDLANAMKSEICLFEAAYAKYHQGDETRARKYYDEVIKACNEVMNSYSLCNDYRSLYNSVFTADAALGLVSLQDNPEVIFMKGYKVGSLCHSMCKYLSSNTPIAGMTKDAFDAYLFKDGKPRALTSEDTSDAPEVVTNENGDAIGLDISKALATRDGRLAQTIDSRLAFGANVTFARETNGVKYSDNLSSNTGYTICKYVNPNIPYANTATDNTNYTCAPLYWLANIYLDYAEARAEIGALTDADLNNTINKLYERAGLPSQTVASLSNMNDPANNMNVSSLLWEIRRCRRCELMFDQYHRYWDLIRWHCLDLLDTTNYPNIACGANVSTATTDQLAGVYTTDGYINAAKNSAATSVRTFTEREYLQPLGTTIIKLYADKGLELPQNPGW